jgi:hypothetical protein
MKQVTEFLRIRAELSIKSVDNLANSTGFYIFENFLFLTCLNCILTEFFWFFLNFLKNQQNH